MESSRRAFLRIGGRIALGGLIAGKITPSGIARSLYSIRAGMRVSTSAFSTTTTDPLYGITCAMFAQNLKTKFTFGINGVKLTDMTLEGVEDLTPAPFNTQKPRTKECFSLSFQGPRSLQLRQDTYEVSHAKLGTFRLFIVPGKSTTAPSPLYEAIINRLYP